MTLKELSGVCCSGDAARDEMTVNGRMLASPPIICAYLCSGTREVASLGTGFRTVLTSSSLNTWNPESRLALRSVNGGGLLDIFCEGASAGFSASTVLRSGTAVG